MPRSRSQPLNLMCLALVSWIVRAGAVYAADARRDLLLRDPLGSLSTISAGIPEAEETPTADAEPPWDWQIRPKGPIYDTYWASAAEPRLGAQLIEEHDAGTFLDSQIGGRLGLLRYGPKDLPEGFQLDVLGGAKLRQDWDGDLDVLATDFRYDILGTYCVGPHRFKFGFYHISSHTGDEFLLKNPDFERLNYSRDTLVAGYSYYPIPAVRLYAEAGWASHCDISQPWHIQFGVDCGPRDSTGSHGAPFFAANVHLREELDFGGNLAVETGWAWRGDDILDGILRTGAYFYEGGSPHFSFYAEHERQVGWGLWYDY